MDVDGYDGSPGATPLCNIYVTLGKVTWQVNASASNGTGGWALTPGSSVSTPVPDASSTEFPYWIRVGSQ
jgi:P pilus assembly chaperone PapD